MTALAQYDRACAALAAAVKADEVMTVRLEAAAIEAIGRVAKNVELEVQARTLRTRAEARLGQMLDEGEAAGIIARRGRQPKDSGAEYLRPATLSEIGIDPKLSARARKLSGLGEERLQQAIHEMEEVSRKERKLAGNIIDQAIAKRSAGTRRKLAQELSDATAALSPTGRKFAVLYADPAWKRKSGIGDRAYENNYVTMTWEEILAMPVADRLLPDAWGFIWIPRAHLLALVEIELDTPLGRCRMKVPLAWAIQIKWGFDRYSTCAVWTKTDDEFPDDHGTGLVLYDQDELLLIFKRGRGLPKPDTNKKHGSNYRARSGRHSEKPAYYRDMINDMTCGEDGEPVQVLELFAREDDDHVLPPNFYTWGNQSKNTAEIECDEAFDSATGEIGPAPKHSDDRTNASVNAERVPETESISQPPSIPEDDGLDIRKFAGGKLYRGEARP